MIQWKKEIFFRAMGKLRIHFESRDIFYNLKIQKTLICLKKEYKTAQFGSKRSLLL